jgi:hypothetical protein
MQLLMRRPEIEGFMSIAPQPNTYDFSFLAPCPSSGLIINGDADKVAPEKDVNGLVEKLKTQKGILITHKVGPGRQPLLQRPGRHADGRMRGLPRPPPQWRTGAGTGSQANPLGGSHPCVQLERRTGYRVNDHRHAASHADFRWSALPRPVDTSVAS